MYSKTYKILKKLCVGYEGDVVYTVYTLHPTISRQAKHPRRPKHPKYAKYAKLFKRSDITISMICDSLEYLEQQGYISCENFLHDNIQVTQKGLSAYEKTGKSASKK